MIVDNHCIHKSIAVRLWQEDHPQLQLFVLAPYAPEVNPDEYLNNDVGAHVACRRPSTLIELTETAVAFLSKHHTSSTHSDGNICRAP